MANRGDGGPILASFLRLFSTFRPVLVRFLLVLPVICAVFDFAASQVQQQETTHDGIAIFEYESYRSVSMVSYYVPEKTTTSTWIIKAYGNNRGCESKNVTLKIRHSGYPLANPWHDEYPPKFQTGGTNTYSISFRSDNVSVAFFAMNPLPGNWYGAAYIQERADNHIAQKGLGVSCTYFFRVSHVVLTLDSVAEILLPSDKTWMVYELTIPANNHSRISRFVLPEGVTSYQVIVNSCFVGKQTSDLANITCPIAIYSEALSLPKTASASTNCSKLMSTPCIHINYRPAPNVWNYLGIIKNTNESVKLKLRIMYQACRTFVNSLYTYQSEILKDVSPTQMIPRENTFTSAYPNVTDVDGLYMVPPTPKSPRYLVNPKKVRSRSRSKAKKVRDNYKGCITHPPMEKRRRTEQYFMFAILYPDLRSNGHKLNVTDSIIVSKFHLQAPNLDGGGTMNLKVQFVHRTKDDYLDDEIQKVSIEFCFQKNVIPVNGTDILCDSGYMITINTSSKLVADWLYVPYPEEGQWYLAIKRTCYLEDPLGTSKIILQNCEDDFTEIVYILDSMPCVEKNCNSHGKCHMYYSNLFFFSACKCHSGYRGYGCSDSTHAKSHSELLAGVLLLTMSNLFFLPAAILAFYRRYFVEGTVYLFTMFFSTFYHACDQDMGYSLCIIPYTVLSYCDFYGSIMSFAVTLIAMSKLQEPVRSVSYTISALFLAFGVEWDKHSLWVFAVPVVLGLTMLIISWSCMCHKRKTCFPSKKRWFLCVVPGALLAIIGCCLFAFVETTDNYQYIHSSWHVLMATSVMFVLPPRVKEKRESQESLLLGRSSAGCPTDTSHDNLAMTADNGSGSSRRGPNLSCLV